MIKEYWICKCTELFRYPYTTLNCSKCTATPPKIKQHRIDFYDKVTMLSMQVEDLLSSEKIAVIFHNRFLERYGKENVPMDYPSTATIQRALRQIKKAMV